MRPCRQCRSPIENNIAVCPQCNTAQDDRAKPTGPVPPPILRRRLFRRAPPAPAPNQPPPPLRRRGFVASVFADVFGLFLDPRGFVFLTGLLLLGALVGGVLADVRGVAAGLAGAVIAILLCFALLRLLSSSEG